ncbi:hypothetical protein H1164_03775 [Thermoactinomyces daqus]|uniref:Uncharacterized protein n=1 Tax=Thermoactinomyces daqus TaxID=1329516 RepID=A0A7W1X8G8_9BACL|nr:hypothetical protein [Thermoactinomyces daqus]MBA4542020.1 hypothetical protein [Thermoactinomyces daqus]
MENEKDKTREELEELYAELNAYKETMKANDAQEVASSQAEDFIREHSDTFADLRERVMNAGTIEVKLTRPELVLICEALTEYMRMYMRMNNYDGVCASKHTVIEPLLNRLISRHLDYQNARDYELEKLMREFVEGVRRLFRVK